MEILKKIQKVLISTEDIKEYKTRKISQNKAFLKYNRGLSPDLPLGFRSRTKSTFYINYK